MCAVCCLLLTTHTCVTIVFVFVCARCCLPPLTQSLSGLQSSVECVVFGEKEDTIAAGGSNGTVKVWDMESGKGESWAGVCGCGCCKAAVVGFSCAYMHRCVLTPLQCVEADLPNGSWLHVLHVLCADKPLCTHPTPSSNVHNKPSKKQTFKNTVSRSLTGHRAHCLSLAFTSADQNFLVSGSRDCNVKVWDLRRKEAIVTFKGHKNAVMKVAPSPDNKWVCSGSEDGDLKVGGRGWRGRWLVEREVVEGV